MGLSCEQVILPFSSNPPNRVKVLIRSKGPNEISIFHPDVFAATDGPGNTCSKAVWYDFLLPEVAVNTTRDKAAHDQRRRIWDHGFTKKGNQTD